MLDSLMTPPPEQVLDVTALTRLIKGQLEENFSRVWVKGEVSNLRKQSSGHIYFSLKDTGSQLPCALFARDAARQSFELQDGMEVLLLGDVSVFEPHGRYQLIAKIVIQSGEGRLQLEYERLKRKLAAEGLFDAEHKKPLPTLPQKIAVITSPTGAAVRDFLRILRRRAFAGEVVILPARVQGKGATEEVAAMLGNAVASEGFDLIVITRGGGSIEDLWAFNEEALARAVAACPLPIISAIGHEIDTVLTDYAADKRAETPSGAAELISSLYIEARSRCEDAESDLHTWVEGYLNDLNSQMRDLSAHMRIIAPDRRLQHISMRMDEMETRLSSNLARRITTEQQVLSKYAKRIVGQHPKTRIGIAYQHFKDFSRRLERAKILIASKNREKLQSLQQRLENGSLQATLQRGYVIIKNSDGIIIDRASLALKEPQLKARFHDGEIALKNDKTTK
jgi:exodeoxyribonuclease VII large subunit